MTDISACAGRIELEKCKVRHSCRRFEIHLNSTSTQQSYARPKFGFNDECEIMIKINNQSNDQATNN